MCKDKSVLRKRKNKSAIDISIYHSIETKTKFLNCLKKVQKENDYQKQAFVTLLSSTVVVEQILYLQLFSCHFVDPS